jgi:signal transduction histidine kinase
MIALRKLWSSLPSPSTLPFSQTSQLFQILKQSIAIFLPTSLLATSFFALHYYQGRTSAKQLIEKSKIQEVLLKKSVIAIEIKSIFSDLIVQAKQSELQAIIDNENLSRDKLEQEYFDIVKYQQIYDQIRFLDATGQEIVRADFNLGKPHIVPEEKLQSKAKRYWFKETIALDQNQIFISPLDLNVENEQIEKPFKPMIRFGTPIFDKNGQKQGIVVLNYRAEQLRERLEKDSNNSPGDLMLLNKEGFWLKSPHPEDEWGFMLPDRKDRTFGNDYPAAWKRISQSESGTFYTSDGLFTFTTISPVLEAYRATPDLYQVWFADRDRIDTQTLQWKLVAFVPQSELTANVRQWWEQICPLYFGSISLVGLASGVLAFLRVQRQLSEEELHQTQVQLQEFALREELLKNRLASQIRDSLDLNTILETVVRESRNLLQIDRCVFGWYCCELDRLYWEAIAEAKHPHLPSLLDCPATEGIEPLIDRLQVHNLLKIDNLETLDDLQLQQLLTSWGYSSAIVLGVRTRGGEWGTLICGESRKPREWSAIEVETIEGIGEQLAIALNQAELYTESQANALAAQTHAQQLQATLQDLKRTQVQLVQSEKMSSLGQLVAGVAHEINNPVSFIHGNLVHTDQYTKDLLKLLLLYQKHYPHPDREILEEMDNIDLEFISEDLLKMIRSMQMGTERIREIVKSLRTFSRLDEAQLKDVNLHEGITNTLTILHHRLKAQPHRPAIQAIEDYEPLPLVECYAGQLNQVFMNLIANAIDALEESFFSRHLSLKKNGTPLEIRISTKVLSNGWIAIRIADNGKGIPEEMRSRLFDPFFTTKPVGKGTGLGLSISYKIVVEQHGGKLEFSSILGQGTEFTIEIPQQQHPSLSKQVLLGSSIAT